MHQRTMYIKQLSYFYLLLLLAACSGNKAEKAGEARIPLTNTDEVSLTQAQLAKAGLALGSFEQKQLSSYLQANGIVDVPPQNFATVSVPMGGFVKSTDMLPGTKVKKGQVLAIMEHPDYIQLQQDYLQALSQQRLAQQELHRQAELIQEEVGARKKLQQAEADARIIGAEVNSLEARLKMLNISLKKLQQGTITSYVALTAPINGYVKSVNVNIGKFVNPSEVMFELIDKEHMHLELKIFEKDMLKVQEGQQIIFHVPNLPELSMEAEVFLIGKVFENESRSINVHGHLKQDYSQLIPGMYVNAQIITGTHAATVLPEAALVREGDQQFIFVQIHQQGERVYFKKLPVETGIAGNGYVEVHPLSTTADNYKVVVKGAYYLQAEMMREEE